MPEAAARSYQLGIAPRIVFVNRYFAPDQSATSQILGDLAFHLAGLGFEVHVVCGDLLYGEAANRLAAEQLIHGVHVHRVSGGLFGGSGLAGRALDYLGLYGRLRSRVSRLLRPGDILVAKTDPPMLSAPLAGLARRRSAVFIPWLQDLYPEVATALRVPFAGGVMAKYLSLLRDRSLLHAAAIVAIGHKMSDRLVARGAPADRIRVIPNWADDHAIAPVPHAENALRSEWGLDGKFVVGYSGTLGRAHECATVLDAAQRLRLQEDLVFLVVGGGHHHAKLRAQVEELGVERMFQFQPQQSRGLLAHTLSASDVHWLSLRSELEGLVVPSKFYGIAAAGRPIINVASHSGELAGIIERFGCGMTVAPGDGRAFAQAILTLKAAPDERAAMGERSRRMLVEHYSQRVALQTWASMLQGLV